MSYLTISQISSILFFSVLFISAHAARFEIRNECPYTVWAAASPGGGRRLDPRQSWTINVPAGTAMARIWGRTNCNFDANGRGHCQTGDCGGLLECQGWGVPPNTLAEYSLNQFGNMDFYDISLIDGFNIPMVFGPTNGGCHNIRCTADLKGQCPNELRAPGGCNNPCTVFKTNEYCCTQGYGTCGPTYFSRFFKDRCHDSYSYPQDDPSSTFTCPAGSNYRVVFCPRGSPRPFFCHKAVIPNLKRLTLSSIGIHMIWHHPSSSSLTHLYRLRVEGCHNLKYLFPSFLLKDLVLLRFLEIKDCNMMEQVIFTDGLGAEDHWRNYTILLESLSLKDLPKLKDICFENYLEFPWLRDLTLKNCPLLKTFISKSVSGDEPPIHQPTQTNDSAVLNEKVVFPRLEELLIQDCESLEEIIELQGLIANESQSTSATLSIVPETVTTKFVFPHVTHLGLGKLPRLKSFFSRMHTTQWPSLKQMEVIECPKARIFGEVQISNQQPLFCVNEDTFPVLEGLTLKTSDMIKGICDGQLSLQCFPNLKLLNLQFFPQTSTTLPYCFIRSLPKLQKLVINNASISELVQSEGLSHKGGHTSAFPQLKELSLSELPELTLKTFEPSLLSLKNLTTLEVSICQAFINLMACSTSKSLTLLERLSIADCELLEEIISCEGEDLQGSIVFPKLKYLKLSHLPSLASFSLAHHSLEFPVLQMVIVTECPKMKNFCQGELSTPRLEQMHLTRDEDGELQWEGDLNTTIKHMFDEMNMQNSQAVEVTDQLLQME